MPPLGELPISRLTLGTVQLGMPYGIANTAGQPDYEQARSIVRAAYAGGVTCFDTAAGYGQSERVLGRALAELGIADQVVVTTKLRHLRGLPAAEVPTVVEESVRSSLDALRLESLPVCLFHLEEDWQHLDALRRLQDRDLVRHIGCSVMSPAAAVAIVRSGVAEAVQLPTSVLDRRFLPVIEEAAAGGVAVFVRSVYLQGLLLMPEGEVPPALQGVILARRALARLAADAGLGLDALAFRFALGLDCASVLVGVETPAQLRANLALLARGPLPGDLQRAVMDSVPDLPEDVLMPNRWSP